MKYDDGREWLYRPVGEKMIPWTALTDGSVDLKQIAEMNDYLDIRDENEARARKAQERKQDG